MAYLVSIIMGNRFDTFQFAERLRETDYAEYYLAMVPLDPKSDRWTEETELIMKEGIRVAVTSDVGLYLLMPSPELEKASRGALEYVKLSIFEDMENVDLMLQVCSLYLELKNYEKARFFLSRASSIEPGNPEIETKQEEVQEKISQDSIP